jgi:hypothetical protein
MIMMSASVVVEEWVSVLEAKVFQKRCHRKRSYHIFR